MQDISENQYGKLRPVKIVKKTKNGQFYWSCNCECGGSKEVRSDRLKSGEVKSCGCVKTEYKTGAESPNFKHGLSKTVLYDLWNDIKARCNCNIQGTPNFMNYKAKGITVHKDFDDFFVFAAELGEPPFKGASIDRIDNTKGYEPGNIRWATKRLQSRNRGKTKSNTSGTTGVSFCFSGNPNHNTYVLVTWRNLDSTSGSKKFSVRKNGLLPAFKMACEYRLKKIEELNNQGAGYTENHGK